MFASFEKHGLIVSKKKMIIGVTHIDFLGSEIGQGTIQLQPAIATKVLSFPDKLDDLKTLRSFLGLVNYARPYIKDLGKLTDPLYNKTNITGQRSFNKEDIELVRTIKIACSNLLKLALLLDSDYLIVESDRSELGWGGVLYKKKNKYEPKSFELLCRYASGKYTEK